MRVAALYDIHGNLPAKLSSPRFVTLVSMRLSSAATWCRPMPGEALDCLLPLDIPTQFIVGNGELNGWS